MKKISRTMARIVIVLAFLFLLFVIIGLLLSNKIFVYIGCVFIVISCFLRLFFLKCPYCGNSYVPAQWNKNKTMHCIKCGKELEYDR